jgi:hypothetical protein
MGSQRMGSGQKLLKISAPLPLIIKLISNETIHLAGQYHKYDHFLEKLLNFVETEDRYHNQWMYCKLYLALQVPEKI